MEKIIETHNLSGISDEDYVLVEFTQGPHDQSMKTMFDDSKKKSESDESLDDLQK